MPKKKNLLLRTIYSVMAALSISSTASLAAPKETDLEMLNHGQTLINTEERSPGERHFVKARILIHAPANIVWQSVHNERKRDPDIAYSKVLQQVKNESTLEQKFVLLPVIGTAICLMSNTEIPLSRIDYKLLKSDRFKSMEGSWILTPHEGGAVHDSRIEFSSAIRLSRAPVDDGHNHSQEATEKTHECAQGSGSPDEDRKYCPD